MMFLVGLHPRQPGAVSKLLETQEALHALQFPPGFAGRSDDGLDVGLGQVAVLESERDVAQKARFRIVTAVENRCDGRYEPLWRSVRRKGICSWSRCAWHCYFCKILMNRTYPE
jgi:hypothetical protein